MFDHLVTKTIASDASEFGMRHVQAAAIQLAGPTFLGRRCRNKKLNPVGLTALSTRKYFVCISSMAVHG